MDVATQADMPVQPSFCPLGDEHCALLNELLRSCHDLKCYLDKLQSIGLDTSDWAARNDHVANLARGLKAVHFPEQA